MFVAMGLSAVFPVIHGLSLYGVEQMKSRIGLPWLVLQGALYIIGAGFYAVCTPIIFGYFASNTHGDSVSLSGEDTTGHLRPLGELPSNLPCLDPDGGHVALDWLIDSV